MPAPYSLDLRQKVVSKYTSGEFTQEEVSKLFGINISTFKRWHVMYKNTGNLEPITEKKGRPAKLDQVGLTVIEKAVELNNTITLDALSALYFKKRKIRVGRSILSRALAKLNLNRKKLSVSSAEKDSPESKKKERRT